MKNRLKEERKLQGITQEELGKNAGVARSIISGLESGRTITTTTDTLEKIAKALSKNVTDIFF